MSVATTTTATVQVQVGNIALGSSVPPYTPHAISVSLPTWKDVVGYEEGDKRVVNAMVSGYPRFFIHLSIQKLARIFERKYAALDERCMLFPTHKVADHCRCFLEARSIPSRLIHLFICPEDKDKGSGRLVDAKNLPDCTSSDSANLHIVIFPADAFPLAKQFWQHSGMGISSRLAEHCLSMLPDEQTQVRPISPVSTKFPFKVHNRHYSVKGGQTPKSLSIPQQPISAPANVTRASSDEVNPDLNVYLEERYGRNLPLEYSASAKRALRRRVAGVLIRDGNFDCQGEPCAGEKDLVVGPSSRGVADVTEHDVYLFPTGMSAIWNAHNLALSVLPAAKSVCFGFPYTDTLKILQKWGPGCHFFGHGSDSDIDELEKLLEEQSSKNPQAPPILALFTEFPSNPLLRSADLSRLRHLADKYDFLIVVDETIGNFVNVEVLPYADVVVSSLSKIFSGASNVMGGSLVLNPKARHYVELKAYLDANYEDLYYDEDAIFMERNSRDFQRRIKVIDANTEAVCDWLRARSLAVGAPSPVIKEVFYPKYVTPEHYARCRIQSTVSSGGSEGQEPAGGGYGGLFSLTFTSPVAAHAFFDALPCYKGPSLGTNFTLACPFTILAHYAELEWAAQYGVEEGLVRISVGMEDIATLTGYFETALKAAEDAVRPAQ